MKIFVMDAFRYAAASGCALIIDIATLGILIHYFSWWYLAAASTSFVAGLFVAYILSVTLVFKQRRLSDRRVEFASFAAIGAVGLAINAAVIFVAVKYLVLNYFIAKCVAAVFTFICNFISRRQFLFVQRNYI